MEEAPTILVVDDDPSLIAVIEATLESGGYEVVSTWRPQEALKLLEARDVEAHKVVLHPQANA